MCTYNYLKNECNYMYMYMYIIIAQHEKSSVQFEKKKVQTLDSCFGLLSLSSRGAAQSLPGTARLKNFLGAPSNCRHMYMYKI